MKHTCKKAAALGAAAAAAAAYSFLPSQAGKLNHRIRTKSGRIVSRSAGLSDRVLYLTFDDGPHPVYTARLLDLLGKYQIKAAFFVVAKTAGEHPDLIKRMAEEGHTIGLHSYEHRSAMVQTPGYTAMDFRKSIKTMERLSVRPSLYRPPWGHVNWFTLREIKRYGLKKVLWDVMAQDWEGDSDAQEMQYKLLKKAGPGSIICLHDGRGENHAPQRMIEALEKTIPIWLEEGYNFEALK